MLCTHFVIHCPNRLPHVMQDVKRVVPTQDSPFINRPMYDDFSDFLDGHNSFGFPQDAFRKLAAHASSSWIPDDVLSPYHNISAEIRPEAPDVVSDHGTQTSASLITPTEPLVGTSIFSPPPQHSIHQPFASGSWLPTDSDRMSFHHDSVPNASANTTSEPPSHGREFDFHHRQEDTKCSKTNYKGHSQSLVFNLQC